MLVLPAIDLHQGKCVRLFQGDLQQKTVYGHDPLKVALKWIAEGAQMLHLVDLDGAFAGESLNMAVVKKIAGSLAIPVQLGGGIRKRSDVDQAFAAGVSRVVLGTMALDNTDEAKAITGDYPGRVLVAIDAKKGKVAVEGWTRTSTYDMVDFARMVEQWGVDEIIYTDIMKDGTMSGPNLAGLEKLVQGTEMKVIMSGGISSREDIEAIKPFAGRVSGIIIGKALYTGQLLLPDIFTILPKTDHKEEQG